MRLEGGREICSPDKTRTTVWKPPLTNPWLLPPINNDYGTESYIHFFARNFDGMWGAPPKKSPEKKDFFKGITRQKQNVCKDKIYFRFLESATFCDRGTRSRSFSIYVMM